MGRRLGQHFLKHAETLQRIAEAACLDCEPLVIEIGPGRGALTGHLLARARRVVAIETDLALIQYLEEKFAGTENLTLVHGDVLKTDLSQWGPAIVAGNLPYYITSPILARTLSLGPRLRHAVFLLQREVAERLTARPGTRQYGFLTAHAQLLSEVETLFHVPPSAFRPPPKVDSTVVRLRPIPEQDRVFTGDPLPFLEFVSACFRMKRKTLRNNLAGRYGKAPLDALPEASRRAEQLSPADLVRLYRCLAG